MLSSVHLRFCFQLGLLQYLCIHLMNYWIFNCYRMCVTCSKNVIIGNGITCNSRLSGIKKSQLQNLQRVTVHFSFFTHALLCWYYSDSNTFHSGPGSCGILRWEAWSFECGNNKLRLKALPLKAISTAYHQSNFPESAVRLIHFCSLRGLVKAIWRYLVKSKLWHWNETLLCVSICLPGKFTVKEDHYR